MKNILNKSVCLSHLMLFLIIYNSNTFTQTSARIENTNLEIDNGRLIISYDLVNTKPNERFNVWVDITKSSGEVVNPMNISGHIGNNIVGGKGLNVVWNFESDGINYEDEIYVQVFAELITVHDMKIEKILLKSAIFPGWGLYDIDKISPYLLIGVAGYSSLAASLIYYNKSNKTYDKYLESDEPTERESLYNDYSRQTDTKKIFGISTAALWILDIGWSTIKYINKTSKINSYLNPNIHIGYDFYAYGNTPVLSLKYNF